MISKKNFIFQGVEIQYWQKGETPRVLIVSGAHGDEHGVVPIVASHIEKCVDAMPEFLFIPELSPSAMKRRTRLNARGQDIERNFYDASPHNEARAIMELLRGRKFDLCVSFHEDREWDGFYMYDIAHEHSFDEFHDMRHALARANVLLHTGLDDTNDPLLGNSVENGYVHIPMNDVLLQKPLFGAWLFKNVIVSRMVVPEIPMKMSAYTKGQIVKICFDAIVLRAAREKGVRGG